MASAQFFNILAILAILVPLILATEFVVGDHKGWTINFDYQAWAEGKEFHVGDKLCKFTLSISLNSLCYVFNLLKTVYRNILHDLEK
jgi:hypothetical protein